jgi:hypothetical protein
MKSHKKIVLPRNRRRVRHSGEEKSSSSKRLVSILTPVLATLTVVGAALTLTGFGVALALGSYSKLGLFRIADSAYMCLKLSSLVVVTWYLEFSDFVSNVPIQLSIVMAASLAAAAMVGYVIFIAAQSRLTAFAPANNQMTDIVSKTKTLFPRRLDIRFFGSIFKLLERSICLIALSVRWVVRVGCIYTPRYLHQKLPHAVQTLFAGVVGGAIGFAAIHVVAIACMSLLLVLVALPVIGFNVGRDHYFESVIEPLECSPIVSLNQERLKLIQERLGVNQQRKKSQGPYFAQCIALSPVSDTSRVIAAGRLIVELSDAVVLYNPKAGTAEIVPSKDMRITQVDKL